MREKGDVETKCPWAISLTSSKQTGTKYMNYRHHGSFGPFLSLYSTCGDGCLQYEFLNIAREKFRSPESLSWVTHCFLSVCQSFVENY